MLTRQQKRLLDFIDGSMKATGVCPSCKEMTTALGLKSKSNIHRLLSALEERGFIRRMPHRARAIEIVSIEHAPGDVGAYMLSLRRNGWRTAPGAPTPEMLTAAINAMKAAKARGDTLTFESAARIAWRAMMDAAPFAPITTTRAA